MKQSLRGQDRGGRWSKDAYFCPGLKMFTYIVQVGGRGRWWSKMSKVVPPKQCFDKFACNHSLIKCKVINIESDLNLISN